VYYMKYVYMYVRSLFGVAGKWVYLYLTIPSLWGVFGSTFGNYGASTVAFILALFASS